MAKSKPHGAFFVRFDVGGVIAKCLRFWNDIVGRFGSGEMISLRNRNDFFFLTEAEISLINVTLFAFAKKIDFISKIKDPFYWELFWNAHIFDFWLGWVASIAHAYYYGFYEWTHQIWAFNDIGIILCSSAKLPCFSEGPKHAAPHRFTMWATQLSSATARFKPLFTAQNWWFSSKTGLIIFTKYGILSAETFLHRIGFCQCTLSIWLNTGGSKYMKGIAYTLMAILFIEHVHKSRIYNAIKLSKKVTSSDRSSHFFKM